MERRVLKLGGRSCGDGMEGVAWKELEGMVDMEWNGWNSVQRYNFSLILPSLGV